MYTLCVCCGGVHIYHLCLQPEGIQSPFVFEARWWCIVHCKRAAVGVRCWPAIKFRLKLLRPSLEALRQTLPVHRSNSLPVIQTCLRRMHTHAHTCTNTRTHSHACTNACTYTHAHTHIYTCARTHLLVVPFGLFGALGGLSGIRATGSGRCLQHVGQVPHLRSHATRASGAAGRCTQGSSRCQKEGDAQQRARRD